jgi:hypothetical protein
MEKNIHKIHDLLRPENFGLRYYDDFFVYHEEEKTFYTTAFNLGWAAQVSPEYFWIVTEDTIGQFDLMEVDMCEKEPYFRYVCEKYGSVAIVFSERKRR